MVQKAFIHCAGDWRRVLLGRAEEDRQLPPPLPVFLFLSALLQGSGWFAVEYTTFFSDRIRYYNTSVSFSQALYMPSLTALGVNGHLQYTAQTWKMFSFAPIYFLLLRISVLPDDANPLRAGSLAPYHLRRDCLTS